MTTIELNTIINAPVERCFMLSLSVNLHLLSTAETNETAIASVTSGVMKLNDMVTWRAKHFGIYQNLTSTISDYKYPEYFVSEMVKGIFKKIRHQHLFKESTSKTTMTDIFAFEAPLGVVGKLFSTFVLKQYLKKFLIRRNKVIKEAAEGDGWKKLLHEKYRNTHSAL